MNKNKEVSKSDSKNIAPQVVKSSLETIKSQVMDQEVVNSDVPIPRLILCQPISDRVVEGKNTPGQLIRSTTGETVGNKDDVIKIIPIKMENTWVNYEVVGGKAEFRSSEPRNASNEGFPWDFSQGGTEWKRKKAITLFALLPGDVKSYNDEMNRAEKEGDIPDLNKTLMPVVITFQSTSFKTGGKMVADFFTKLKSNMSDPRMTALNIGPWSYQMDLFFKLEKNDKGMYFTLNVGKTEKSDKEASIEAKKWFGIISKGQVRVDDSTGESIVGDSITDLV